MQIVSKSSLFACAIAAAVFGCGHSHHNIVGTWNIVGGPTTAQFTFDSNGSFKTEAHSANSSSTRFGPYKLEGDKLSLDMPERTATIDWKSDSEFVMTGDDGKAMTLRRVK